MSKARIAFGTPLNPPKAVDRVAEAVRREGQDTKTQRVERPAQGNSSFDYTKLVKRTDK